MKIASRSRWFRPLMLVACLPTAILWPAGSASGQLLPPGTLTCPAGAPSGVQVGQGLLGALTNPANGNPLNSAWGQVAPNIEDLPPIEKQDLHVPDGCANGGSDYCTFIAGAGGCSFVFVDIQVEEITGVDE